MGSSSVDTRGIDTWGPEDANGRYRHMGSSRYRHAGPSRMGKGTGTGETKVTAEVVSCVGAFPRLRFCSASSAPSPSEGIWEV